MEATMAENMLLMVFWLVFVLATALIAAGVLALVDWCRQSLYCHQINQLRQQYRCAIPNRALPRLPARLV